MENKSKPRTGGCQCGAVTYAVNDEPLSAYCCHCTECKKQSGSSFGISVIVKADAFSVTQGRTECWSRVTSKGAELKCYFCPSCGVRLWHWADDDPEHISIKGGTLDRPPKFDDLDHIWTSSMSGDIQIPNGAATWENDPN